jgi:hypothetical protein
VTIDRTNTQLACTATAAAPTPTTRHQTARAAPARHKGGQPHHDHALAAQCMPGSRCIWLTSGRSTDQHHMCHILVLRLRAGTRYLDCNAAINHFPADIGCCHTLPGACLPCIAPVARFARCAASMACIDAVSVVQKSSSAPTMVGAVLLSLPLNQATAKLVSRARDKS